MNVGNRHRFSPLITTPSWPLASASTQTRCKGNGCRRQTGKKMGAEKDTAGKLLPASKDTDADAGSVKKRTGTEWNFQEKSEGTGSLHAQPARRHDALRAPSSAHHVTAWRMAILLSARELPKGDGLNFIRGNSNKRPMGCQERLSRIRAGWGPSSSARGPRRPGRRVSPQRLAFSTWKNIGTARG